MIKVVTSGFYTSVQDTGREGYRRMGVPVSGVMDAFSAILANRLLNNPDKAAVLEMTMTGPTLEFTEPTHIVITGAEMKPFVNNEEIPYNRVVKLKQGDILSFGKLQKGFRAYLALKGGIGTRTVMGSRSLYTPITEAARISEGDMLPYTPFDGGVDNHIEIKVDNHFLFAPHLEAHPGPEYELLTDTDKQRIKTRVFKVSVQNNRMAYQLEDSLSDNDFGIITSATLPGTVQLTPAGKMIILMRDCQTTGGYPRILQLSERGVCVLAQKKAGDALMLKVKEHA